MAEKEITVGVNIKDLHQFKEWAEKAAALCELIQEGYFMDEVTGDYLTQTEQYNAFVESLAGFADED